LHSLVFVIGSKIIKKASTLRSSKGVKFHPPVNHGMRTASTSAPVVELCKNTPSALELLMRDVMRSRITAPASTYRTSGADLARRWHDLLCTPELADRQPSFCSGMLGLHGVRVTLNNDRSSYFAPAMLR
jgi:hypothetical protein